MSVGEQWDSESVFVKKQDGLPDGVGKNGIFHIKESKLESIQ